MSDRIVRRWHAVVSRSNLEPWLTTFQERAYPGMRGVAGFCSISIQAERETDPCRVTVQTTWESMDAARAYAGDEPAKAVVPEFMAGFLLEYDAEASFHDELMLAGGE